MLHTARWGFSGTSSSSSSLERGSCSNIETKGHNAQHGPTILTTTLNQSVTIKLKNLNLSQVTDINSTAVLIFLKEISQRPNINDTNSKCLSFIVMENGWRAPLLNYLMFLHLMFFHLLLDRSTDRIQRLFFLIIQTIVKKFCVTERTSTVIQGPRMRHFLRKWE